MLDGTDKAHEVLMAIRQVVRRISEHSKYLSREVGLTVPQLLCLKAIGEMEATCDELTVVMVSKRVQLSAATVSRIIDRLVRAGLVIRERRSKDRRRVCLTLSPAGADQFQSLPTLLQEKFVARFEALDEAHQLSIMNSLSLITELMDATDLDAAPILTPGADVRSEPRT